MKGDGVATSDQAVRPSPPAPVSRQDGRSPWGRRYRKYLVPWLFALPILLINVVVVIGPSLSAIYYSLTDWSGIGAGEFIGLENYRRILFQDMNYRRAFLNNIAWLSFFLTVPFAVSLFAASMLARIRRGSMFFRTALFIP